MGRPTKTSFGIWFAATLAGVAVVGLFTLLFRVPAAIPAPEKPAAAQPPVHLNGAHSNDKNALFSEDETLLDPTPLFVPTRWNSSGNAIAVPVPGRQFSGYPAEPHFNDSKLEVLLPAPVETPGRAEDVITGTPSGAPFLGMGERDMPLPPLPARAACVEIFESTSGRLVLGKVIEASVRAPGGDTWRPMEFIAAVDSAGLVGPLVRTVDSGVEEVDDFFAHYLAQNLKVGHRLEPGFYRISVGP